MSWFVAGDIGGTNSRLQLLRSTVRWTGKLQEDTELGAGEELIAEETYASQAFPSLEIIIRAFLDKFLPTTSDKQYCPRRTPIYCMCLAVAGPVSDNRAQITNVKWVVDGPALSAAFQIPQVRLINDFVGNGYGLLALQPHELEAVYTPPAGTPPAPHGVKAVIGAGTGLGQCFLTFNGRNYDVWASEGGHTDFPPRNQLEFDLQEYIRKEGNLSRVSIERVVSGGLGLPKIYAFLSQRRPGMADADLARRIRAAKDPGPLLAEGANTGKCPVCVETFDVFMRLYGAEAGNQCLKLLPLGGLYIAGGIAGKNLRLLRKEQQFVRHFLDKGRLSAELRKIPIFLITHPQVGLLGSKVICRRMLAERKADIVAKL